MRNAACAAAMVSVLAFGPAQAAERLAPEGSTTLADYEAQVGQVLHGAFERDVRLRAIFEPAFQPEFAVGLRGRPEAPVIFMLQPSRQVWSYSVLQMMKDGRIQVLGKD